MVAVASVVMPLGWTVAVALAVVFPGIGIPVASSM